MSESIRGFHDKVLLTYLIPATVGAAGQRSHSGGAAAAVQRSERSMYILTRLTLRFAPLA